MLSNEALRSSILELSPNILTSQKADMCSASRIQKNVRLRYVQHNRYTSFDRDGFCRKTDSPLHDLGINPVQGKGSSWKDCSDVLVMRMAQAAARTGIIQIALRLSF